MTGQENSHTASWAEALQALGHTLGTMGKQSHVLSHFMEIRKKALGYLERQQPTPTTTSGNTFYERLMAYEESPDLGSFPRAVRGLIWCSSVMTQHRSTMLRDYAPASCLCLHE